MLLLIFIYFRPFLSDFFFFLKWFEPLKYRGEGDQDLSGSTTKKIFFVCVSSLKGLVITSITRLQNFVCRDNYNINLLRKVINVTQARIQGGTALPPPPPQKFFR